MRGFAGKLQIRDGAMSATIAFDSVSYITQLVSKRISALPGQTSLPDSLASAGQHVKHPQRVILLERRDNPCDDHRDPNGCRPLTTINGIALGLWLASSAQASPQASLSTTLLLRQEFGRALFSECQLSVGYAENRPGPPGLVRLRCLLNVIPSGRPVQRERVLRADERTQVISLVEASTLLSGGNLGRPDARVGIEGPFETLGVTRGQTTGVLVITGNPTFDSGSRRALLDLLHVILQKEIDAAMKALSEELPRSGQRPVP
jgi:hypothetical protein